jgi:hypothetical protein
LALFFFLFRNRNKEHFVKIRIVFQSECDLS